MLSLTSLAVQPPERRLRSIAQAACRVQPLSSDEEIVAGLLAGQRWAADQLYERVHVQVRASLRRLLRGRGADYDDLMQASFERILRVLSTRPLKSPFNLPGWASAVATHVALDALRRNVREQRLFAGEAAVSARSTPPQADPEHDLATRAEVRRVQTLLAAMRPKYAEALVLHDVLGHELSAIADITGVSVAAAQSRLSRGRRELQKRAQAQSRRASLRTAGASGMPTPEPRPQKDKP